MKNLKLLSLFVITLFILLSGCVSNSTRKSQFSSMVNLGDVTLQIQVAMGYTHSNRCVVYGTLTNNSSSRITGSIELDFYDENNKYIANSELNFWRGIPAGQKIELKDGLSGADGHTYFPYACPNIRKFEARGRTK